MRVLGMVLWTLRGNNKESNRRVILVSLAYDWGHHQRRRSWTEAAHGCRTLVAKQLECAQVMARYLI